MGDRRKRKRKAQFKDENDTRNKVGRDRKEKEEWLI
jgi:hypothetical protein